MLIDRYLPVAGQESKANAIAANASRFSRLSSRKQEKRKPVKIEPVVERIQTSPRVEKEKQIPLFKSSSKGGSTIPPLALLDQPGSKVAGYSKAALEAMSQQLELKLRDFGIEVQVESVHPGPVITRFEILPAPGVKVSQISNLSKDLARSLSVIGVRVVEIIPGKSVMGLEIPNEHREVVALSEIVQSRAFDEASHHPSRWRSAKTSAAKPWWLTWPRCRICWLPVPPVRVSQWR